MKTSLEDDLFSETISALLDGEKPALQYDAKALDQPEYEARRQQYRKISQWLHELPDPAPAPGFVERAMARIDKKRSPWAIRHSQRAWAAAAALLLLCLAAYWQHALFQARNNTLDVSAVVAPETGEHGFDLEPEKDLFEDDALLWPVLDEMPEGAALGEVLAQFEYLSAEELTGVLVEMALNEASASANEQEPSDLNATANPAWYWRNEDALSDAFEWIETLDSVEINAFNQMLRAALSEA